MTTSLTVSAVGVSLTIQPLPGRKAQVVLSGDGLVSQAEIEADILGVGALFLQELVRFPNGWPDSKVWRSLEGQLSYKATCDRTGHVLVAVTLGNEWDSKHWSSTVFIGLDLGQLPALSQRFTDFELALLNAA